MTSRNSSVLRSTRSSRPFDGLRERVAHGVEARREHAEFVFAQGGHRALQVAGGDGFGTRAQRVERPQDASRQPGADQQEGDQQLDDDHGEQDAGGLHRRFARHRRAVHEGNVAQRLARLCDVPLYRDLLGGLVRGAHAARELEHLRSVGIDDADGGDREVGGNGVEQRDAALGRDLPQRQGQPRLQDVGQFLGANAGVGVDGALQVEVDQQRAGDDAGQHQRQRQRDEQRSAQAGRRFAVSVFRRHGVPGRNAHKHRSPSSAAVLG
ncbi:MAG: hypothetical protein QM739_04940 [Propionivibrio sp.]